MKKLTLNEWIAVIISIGVPALLMYLTHETTIFSVAILTYVLVAVLEELKKIHFTTLAPLAAYIAMIVYGAVKIVLADEVFHNERIEVLVSIVKYGAILLLAIPLLYKINKVK